MRRLIPLVVCLAALSAACLPVAGGGTSGGGTPDLTAAAVKFTPLADDGQPVTAMAARSGDSGLYVAEQQGVVKALRNGAFDATPVLDIHTSVNYSGEQGLLGLAFSPDGSRLYVHYDDTSNRAHIDEYAFANGVATGAANTVFTTPSGAGNHNGGQLSFGPDGMLYLALGDGGTQSNAQSTSSNNLLGKIVRINPGIPSTNNGSPSIWVLGLRNPWRFSFDRSTNDLWISDVGEDSWEEIDTIPFAGATGKNFGWPLLEGSHNHTSPFDPSSATVRPVDEYSHASPDNFCAIVGGYVYRGAAIPNLVGSYVFTDLCTGEIHATNVQGGTVVGRRNFGKPPGVGSFDLVSLGEDNNGELYVLGQGSGIFRIDHA